MSKKITYFISLLVLVSMILVSTSFAISVAPLKSFSFVKSDITIATTQSYNLGYKVMPTNAAKPKLVWTTANKKIATVDQNGNVVGVSNGKTTITATVSGKKISAKYTVNVLKDSVPVSNPGVFPIVKNKITVKVFGQRNAVQGPWEDMLVIKKMEELTNIHLVFDTPLESAYKEKINLMLVSGDLPDVFMGASLTPQQEEIYGSQGTFIPLDSMINKYCPNFMEKINKDVSIKRAITASNGHIYALPYIVKTKTTGSALLYVDMTWLNNVGVQKPVSTDGLYTVLKAFRDKDPNKNNQKDEIPISAGGAGSLYALSQTILAAFSGQAAGAPVHSSQTNYPGFDIKGGKVVFNPAQSYYKDYLMYMNKLYTEGLLDNESFTQTAATLYAKGKDGKVGVLTASASLMIDTAKNTDVYEELDPLVSLKNSVKVSPEPPMTTTGAFAITNKCKNPAAMLEWVDILYRTVDKEVKGISGLAMFLGIHGESWDYSDSTKTKYIRKSKDPNMTPVEYINKMVTPGGAAALPSWVVTDMIPDGDKMLELKARESTKHFFPYNKPVYPLTARFTQAESETVTALGTDLNTYVIQMSTKFIIGEESFDKYGSYLSNLKKLGVDDITKVMQDAYSRWAAAE